MTVDLKTQIHDFAVEFADELLPVDIESIITDAETAQVISPAPVSKRRLPVWAPAAVAAFLVIVLIGGAALLFANPEDDEVADPVPAPTVPEDVAPDPTPETTLPSEAVEPDATISGMSWQLVTPEGINPLADIAPALISGGDRFIYVHAGNNAISSSFDGINWTKQAIEEPTGDTYEFVAWHDTVVGFGCGGGISSEEFGPITHLPGCVSVIQPDGTVVRKSFDGDINDVGVGPSGIVAAVNNNNDESGLQYADTDELVASLTGRDITEFAVVEIAGGVLHLERGGQVSDYVIADHGYTTIESQSASGWYSTDGEEWTPVSGFPADRDMQLIGTEDGFIAVSGSEVWHSPNGQDWRELGQNPGDPWTLSRWDAGAIVIGTESVWRLSALGIEEMSLSTPGLGSQPTTVSSGDVGIVLLDHGPPNEGWDVKQILYSATGEEWNSEGLPKEISETELAWGWFSHQTVATDQAVLLLLFEARDNEYGQAPVWFLGTPTTG